MTDSRNLPKLKLVTFAVLSFALMGVHLSRVSATQAKSRHSKPAGQHPANTTPQVAPNTPLAPFTVTTLDDSGTGSLRQALLDANATAGADTITFSVTGTINLESSLPSLTDDVTINGPGANLLTVRRGVGGALRIFTINSGKTVSLAGLTLMNGLQDNGGGILNDGTLTVSNCVIAGNAAPDGGGGILNRATLTMTGCTISGNNSAGVASGGLWNLSGSTPATATLTNCTISGNTTGANNQTGSGIDNSADAADATVSLTNCTIANNTATNNTDGGSLYSGKFGAGSANITVKNSLIVGNTNPQVRQDMGGTITSLGNNLISDNSLTAAAGDLLNTNPLLAVLGNYGGPTPTHALLPGSPAINAGTNTGAPTADQRGIARPQQTITDIGAFESRGFTLAVASGNNQSTLLSTAFANPLVVTVSSANSEPVQGGRVTFTPPGNGASASLTGNPATIQANGQASVTALANATAGSYQVTAATSGNVSPVAFLLTNTCPTITLNPANPTLPNGRAGMAYSQSFTQIGGAGTATFTVSAGALPSGLTLAPDGMLSGTPTVNGNFDFTVRATDANLCTGERAYALTIQPLCAAFTVNPATAPNGFVGTAYSQTFTASGGTAPYSFALSAGTLPGGLNLAAGGALTGTPTTAGTFTFTVTATDNTGCTGLRAYTVIISGNGLMFYPLPQPIRLLETRPGQQGCDTPGAPVQGQVPRAELARVTCGGVTIPANAQAVTGIFTVVNNLDNFGFGTLYPAGGNVPNTANLNYTPQGVAFNSFTTGLNAAGQFNIFAFSTVHVVIDITGYFAPPSTGGLFYHVLPQPIRLLETRAGQQGCDTPGQPIQGQVPRTEQARVTCGGSTIPQAAQAITGSFTVVNQLNNFGYGTLYPTGGSAPNTANLNYTPQGVAFNSFITGLNASGQFNLFTFTTVHAIIDVDGYFSPEAADANGTGLLYTPLSSPIRLLETRAGQQGCDTPGAPITGQVPRTELARVTCGGVTIPANAQAIAGIFTVVNQLNNFGFGNVYPTGGAVPNTANLNYVPFGVAFSSFITGLNGGGQFNLFVFSTVHVIIDVAGYFAP